jgi:hypothetical protein
MIKQIWENALLSLKTSKCRKELDLKLYESASRGVKRLAEFDSGIKEERDQTPTSSIPGSHDEYYVRPTTTEELFEIIRESRNISHSPFAISALENRINYIFGDGFKYKVMPKQAGTSEELIEQTQAVIDDFMRANDWQDRQEETQRRLDRDGETFVGFTPAQDLEGVEEEAIYQMNFIEPEYIVPPDGQDQNGVWSWGIKTAEDNVEDVQAYNVKIGDSFQEEIDADKILHRKLNVDRNEKRGFPSLADVRLNLKRANKILRNAGTVAGIQAAIALIRRHASTAPKIQGMIASQEVAKDAFGRSVLDMPEGAIIDTTGGSEYDFPATNVNPTNITGIIQAEIRAVGARFQMPEFMISSDASNANYSSTLVSEGPFVRSIEKLQRQTIDSERLIFKKVIDKAIEEDTLPENVWDLLMLDISAPSLVVRDLKEEAEIAALLIREKISSIERQAEERFGIDDYEAEREIIEAEDNLFRDMEPVFPFNNPQQPTPPPEEDDDE